MAIIVTRSVTSADDQMQKMLNLVYPVGSIYMSATMSTTTEVQNALGGTWIAWGAGRVPVGVDTGDTDFDTVEETGGEKSHTLIVDEMPSHTHELDRSDGGTGYRETIGYSGSSTIEQVGSWGVNYTGGGQAHNNLQPYITCYMYKRTA